MASKTYKFYGITKWAKVHQPDEKYDRFSLDLYMDDPSWDLYRKSGLQLKVKDNEEGKFVTFGRPRAKLIKGEITNFGPPKVVDAVGRPIEDLVGNGSEIAVEVVVYDTVKGKGHRLEKVHVLNLVEFGGVVEDARGGAKEEAPKEVDRGGNKKPGKAAAPRNNDLDDEIPF